MDRLLELESSGELTSEDWEHIENTVINLFTFQIIVPVSVSL